MFSIKHVESVSVLYSCSRVNLHHCTEATHSTCCSLTLLITGDICRTDGQVKNVPAWDKTWISSFRTTVAMRLWMSDAGIFNTTLRPTEKWVRLASVNLNGARSIIQKGFSWPLSSPGLRLENAHFWWKGGCDCWCTELLFHVFLWKRARGIN